MNKVKVYGADWCEDTQRTREQLHALGVSYDYINVDTDKAAEEWAKAQNQGKRKTPTVDLEGTILIEPSNAQMAAALRSRGLIR